MSGWGPRTFSLFGGGGGGGIGNPDLADNGFTVYGEDTVASEATVNLLDYTVGANSIHLIQVEFGGKNIGDYKLLINNTLKARFVTWFNGPMDGFWNFSIPQIGGLPLGSGMNIKVSVTNDRPEPALFFARFLGVNIDV